MGKISTSLPRCKLCGRQWTPALGTPAAFAYCRLCRSERRKRARERFGSAPFAPAELQHRYFTRKRSAS